MFSGTGNTAPGFTMATVLLVLWAFCSFVVRVWTKYKKTDTWGRDDAVLTFSFVAAILQVTDVLFAVHRGYGGAWLDMSEHDQNAVLKTLFAGQLLFVISLGATRASTALFSARVLTMDVGKQRIASSLVGLCGLWTIGSVIAITVRSPLATPWKTIDGSQTMYIRWLSIEITGVFLDLCSLALSVFFIWQLQMTIAKRLTLCALFGIRLATLPIIACRLWELFPKPEDATKANLAAGVLAEAEMCLALILASATCLKPFLQPFDPGWFSTRAPGATGLTGNFSKDTKRSNAYYELSGVRSNGTGSGSKDRREKAMVNVTSLSVERDDDASDELDLIQSHDKARFTRDGLRPDRVEHLATAYAPATLASHHHTTNDRPHRNGGREDAFHITKAQSWSVSYK